MKLTIVNLTGSTKTYLSGAVSVPGSGSTNVTDTTQQLSLSTDGQLRSDLLTSLVQLTDGVNTYGANDALTFLQIIPNVLGPTSDRTGAGIDSIVSAGVNNLLIALGATNYILSSVNTSTAQLAAGATFTGGIENTFNQQSYSVLLTCDQACTVTLNQYIDAAGTFLAQSTTYTLFANQGFAKSNVVNGNFFNIVVKNIGGSTTTTLNLNTAYGTIPSATQLNNQPVSINEVNGIASNPYPDGALLVRGDVKPIFDDTYATSSTLDTVNRWNAPISAGGGVAAAVPVGGGDVALGTGTTANGYSVLTSQYNFVQLAPGFIELQNAVNLEFPITLNTFRYWGFGTPQSVPTAANPLQDGLGFEVATSGKMYAVSYSGGTRNVIADLSKATGTNTQPSDNSVHKYFIYYRGDLAYWKIDNTVVATMLTGAPGPINNTLPLAFLAVAGSSAPSSSGVLTINGTWAGDTAGASTSISDGLFFWRKATVKPTGVSNLSTDTELVVRSIPSDGTKNTYSATITGLQTANSATDIFTIIGSSTKTIRVTRIEVSGTVGGLGGATPDLQLIKRSAANTGGTSTTRTNVPHDSSNTAATAVVKAYTANPSALGTAIGTLRVFKIDFPNSGQAGAALLFWDFGNRPAEGIVLRGAAETLALNLNAASLNTSSIDISIEWTEE